MADKRRRLLAQWFIRVAPIGLALLLAVHFGVTLAYLTPINPLKLRVFQPVKGYMEPFFSQRWTLFAPNVVAQSRALLVSCRTEDAHRVVREHPVVDITQPLRDLKRRHRLTPADRLDRAQITGVTMLHAQDDEAARRLLKKPEDTPAYREAVAAVEQERKVRREHGTRLLARVASAACRGLHPNDKILEVGIRIATLKAPPFSRRMEPEEAGETTYSDLPWQPYEATETL
ncbi:DUF5819 family protein [Comamonas sp. JC664]|uniref:DUF5819 family protein n=1 Tax=Comamonas sp. JC664 TaxID=2801917 RepID=UPI00174B3E9B|nr:DUF5819 family protein [Comamonas sp. JC664]MBL0693326.1 hypothetical protein [Comamonas sp. JC664]GHG71887.1 hypothetical protein GCM10012319_17390 [Comamonas sp. KCTC 72670]